MSACLHSTSLSLKTCLGLHEKRAQHALVALDVDRAVGLLAVEHLGLVRVAAHGQALAADGGPARPAAAAVVRGLALVGQVRRGRVARVRPTASPGKW